MRTLVKDPDPALRRWREDMPGPLPEAPPLRCAVLAWTRDPISGQPEWRIIFANGDEGRARAAAADWIESNEGGECQLMVSAPNGRARLERRVLWVASPAGSTMAASDTLQEEAKVQPLGALAS